MDIVSKLLELLHDIAKNQNCHNYELKVNPVTSGLDSFTSFLYTATITSKNKGDLDLFIKVAAIGAKERGDINFNLYSIEYFVYSDIKNKYRVLEDKHQLPKLNRLNFPEYYGAKTTRLEEILVLENLVRRGFVSPDRFKSVDWQFASAAVTELAKFHALSLAYQRDYPEKFQHFSETYPSDWINEDTVITIRETAFAMSLSVVRDDNKAKLKRFLDSIDLAAINHYCKPLRCKVLAHLDFKPSNLMYRTKDDGNFEIMLLDYQAIQPGSPVLDLLYLIFTGTDKQFRDKYFERLMDHYYVELSEAMQRLSLNPGTIYTREDYYFELKEKLPFGLVIAAFTLLVATMDPEKAPQVDTENNLSSFAKIKTGAVFPERINDIVDDFVRWGVL